MFIFHKSFSRYLTGLLAKESFRESRWKKEYLKIYIFLLNSIFGLILTNMLEIICALVLHIKAQQALLATYLIPVLG